MYIYRAPYWWLSLPFCTWPVQIRERNVKVPHVNQSEEQKIPLFWVRTEFSVHRLWFLPQGSCLWVVQSLESKAIIASWITGFSIIWVSVSCNVFFGFNSTLSDSKTFFLRSFYGISFFTSNASHFLLSVSLCTTQHSILIYQ
jgi:hypothetical protein